MKLYIFTGRINASNDGVDHGRTGFLVVISTVDLCLQRHRSRAFHLQPARSLASYHAQPSDNEPRSLTRNTHTHTHTPSHAHRHNRFTALFSGPPGSAGVRRELLDFMVQRKINRMSETDTLTIRPGATPSGLSSAHLHHPPFYRPDALPAAQPTVSKHWRQQSLTRKPAENAFDKNFSQSIYENVKKNCAWNLWKGYGVVIRVPRLSRLGGRHDRYSTIIQNELNQMCLQKNRFRRVTGQNR